MSKNEDLKKNELSLDDLEQASGGTITERVIEEKIPITEPINRNHRGANDTYYALKKTTVWDVSGDGVETQTFTNRGDAIIHNNLLKEYGYTND